MLHPIQYYFLGNQTVYLSIKHINIFKPVPTDNIKKDHYCLERLRLIYL